MKIKVSAKGQVVLPSPLRRKLSIRAGDSLLAKIEAGRIVLILQRKRTQKVKIVKDSITGLPVLSAGPNGSTLSSREVREILAGFP